MVLGALLASGGGCRDKSSSPASSPLPGDEATTIATATEPDSSSLPPDERPMAQPGDDGGLAPPWATWPMPNTPGSGLPHPQDYDTSGVGVTVDRVTGLTWQRYANPKSATFAEAKSACARLSLAGHDDWRLPSRIELVSIVDLTRSQPAIHPVAFPRTPSDWFWTASAAAESATQAWYVYFYFGYPKTDDVSNSFAVRCVRAAGGAPPAAMEARYTVQTETARDVGTGLTWQRVVPPTKLGFEGARTYCEHLRAGGQTGWRVPSLPELLTLVDEHATAPTIDAAAFPRTPAESFWTSSPFAETAAQAWHVYFDHGNALYGLLNATYHVRCVR